MPWIKLKESQLKKWVVALEQCQAIVVPERRNSVVLNLRDDIRGSISRDSALRIDVLNIVSACDRYPGGLEELVELVRFLEGDSFAVRGLESLLDERFTVLDHEDRQEVVDAVAGFPLPGTVLSKLYGKDLTSMALRMTDGKTLPEILRELALLPPQAGAAFPVPLLEFVERLARFVEPELAAAAARLRAWVDRWAPEVSVSVEQIHDLRIRLQSEAVRGGEHAYIVIEIAPDPYETTKFSLAAWSWKATLGFYEPIDLLPEETEAMPRSQAEIRDLLVRFLECQNNHLRGVMDLTLEFFLPRRLLCWDVDQWTLRLQEDFDTPIGIHYPVVVRSLERTTTQPDAVRRDWIRKWRHVRRGARPLEVFWIRSRDQYGRKALYHELAQPIPDHFCSGLAFSPTEEPEAEDVLDTILLAGLPIAFWLRQPRAQAEIVLEELVRSKNVTDLPEAVREARREAFGREDEHHVGRHLSLLWDDAERRHPGFAKPLARPRLEGGNS